MIIEIMIICFAIYFCVDRFCDAYENKKANEKEIKRLEALVNNHIFGEKNEN